MLVLRHPSNGTWLDRTGAAWLWEVLTFEKSHFYESL